MGRPAISVDAKKKELVGPFKNGGRELRPKGQPEPVRVHDFVDKELGRATPYGVYDLAQNQGWVTVGIDHDTAEFAVASIARWWQTLGQAAYPNATSLLITADGGGSNGSRSACGSWSCSASRTRPGWSCASATCHPAPASGTRSSIGCSRTSPRTGGETAGQLRSRSCSLIAATTTRSGLEVRCELDDATYATGRKVSDAELASVNLERDEFHGEWNYRIRPRLTSF